MLLIAQYVIFILWEFIDKIYPQRNKRKREGLGSTYMYHKHRALHLLDFVNVLPL